VAGFRDFQTGEVLTAANVNDFLAKQSVMKFADAAARDTALGTAVGGGNALREGMVTYLDSTNSVQYYGGTAWAAVGSDPNPGIGSNVVQTTLTSVFTASVAQAAQTPITGLSVTITPSSSSSLVLVIAMITHGSTAGGNSSGQWFTINRGGTDLFIGDAASNRTRVSSGSSASGSTLLDASLRNTTIIYLDSPATTSAVTYGVDGGHNSASTQTIGVNQSRTDSDVSNFARGASSITAIEVAA